MNNSLRIPSNIFEKKPKYSSRLLFILIYLLFFNAVGAFNADDYFSSGVAKDNKGDYVKGQ